MDTTFNGTGKVTTDFASSDDNGNRVAVQSSRKIVLAGFSGTVNNRDYAVARYIGDVTEPPTLTAPGSFTATNAPVSVDFYLPEVAQARCGPASGACGKTSRTIISAPMNVPNLRSPYVKVGGIDYLARLLDKIRLHAARQLPAEYHANLGTGFDGRALSFLWIEYPALVDRVKQGGSDGQILEWAFSQGRRPSPEEIEVWNEFMRKRGWNDESSARLEQRKSESGFAARTDLQTFFDYIDADEGRDPRVTAKAG